MNVKQCSKLSLRLRLQYDSMELFGARPNLPIKTCLDEVGQSDIVVVIVGHRYGNLVPSRNISFSEAEYREAHRLKKSCLVYLWDESTPVLPKNVERDPNKLHKLERWKGILRKRHTISSFTNSSDLAVQVTADLSRTIQTIEEGGKSILEASDQDVSTAVERTQRVRQLMTVELERSFDLMVSLLGDALDLRDCAKEGHTKRVMAFSIAIARAMGLEKEKIRPIGYGAFLPYIGKLVIPDTILRKPAALTPEETAFMREHCFRGYQMLRRIPFLSEAAEIVYAHQERFDGTGYPRGLKGDEIPIGARIFSVADSFDALTSDRPYRAAVAMDLALAEIMRFSGKQFDPAVVRVFLEIPGSAWEHLRKISFEAIISDYPIEPSSTN